MYALVLRIFFSGDEKLVHQLITLALNHPFYSLFGTNMSLDCFYDI